MYRVLLVIFIIIHVFCTPECTFSQSVRFNHFAPDEKFGFGNVWVIFEDHEGFIWFGTEDGLYKYDGYDVVTYQHDKKDTTSISGNLITSIFEDTDKNLWIGTFGDGLNLYNREKNIFLSFKNDPKDEFSLPNNRVKSIIQCSDGKIWLGTEGGGIAIFKFDQENPSKIKFNLLQHNPDDVNSLSTNFIRCLVEDRKNNLLYVATQGGGINCINQKNGVVRHFRADPNDVNALCSDKVYKIFIDSKGRLWAGTLDAGMDLYLANENRFIHYPPFGGDDKLPDNYVESIVEDHLGNIWVGTDNGLSFMTDSKSSIPKNSFKNFKHEPLDEYSLLSNSVKILFVDSRNTLWAGTYFGGVNIYNSKQYKFYPIRNRSWIKTSLSSDNVTAFAQDRQGNLWIGTDAGGLDFLPKGLENPYQDEYKHIVIQNPVTGKIESKIKSLAMDGNGYLWIGLWGDGLYRLDTKTQTLKYYGNDYPKSPLFTGSKVLQIKIDNNNNLWIGTFENGVFYYDQQKNTFTNYLLDPNKEMTTTGERIRAILVDSKERVWVGGNLSGLNLFNKVKNSFERVNYKDILTPNIAIVDLLESRDGKIWMGTVSSGAIAYDPETKKACAYAEAEGLLDHVISAMLEDKSGRIWMSTTKGLSVFNPKDKTTVHYTKTDGLQGNHFNNGSALRASNGMLMFGGTRGWNTFIPESIHVNRMLPKIAFTNFWLNNRLIDVSAAGSPLTKYLNSSSAINLNYNQNSFSIDFVALEFNPAKNNKYAYKLEGFNDTWQYINTDRKATFTNLFPGEYKLRVKATNQDGFWVERPQPLIILIHPAWWQTIWFKLGVIAVTIGLVYLSFWMRTHYLIKQRTKLMKEVQRQTFELIAKNKILGDLNYEIQSQNEELITQNDQIIAHRKDLEVAQDKLQKVNEQLEELVKTRTEKLEATIKELDKTVFELDRFVYSASHDLSAPLKSILGLVHIAKLEKDQHTVSQYYNYIENSINKLEVVIRNLVDYSRNSHLEIAVNPFNFHNMVNDIIGELAFWPDVQNIKIINATNEDIEIVNDEQRIKVVLHNLISNGIKYADLTKGNSFVKIECAKEDDFWNIKISDNGIGIDKENRSKVFEMYYRATDRSKGSGLGLFIVKEIVQKLNGSISVISTKAVGTTFNIKLPQYVKKQNHVALEFRKSADE